MIINPWLFYMMGVSDALVDICFIMAFVGVLAGISFAVGCFCAEYDDEEVPLKWCRTGMRIALIVGLIGVIGTVFVPDEETLLLMQGAKLATADNIELLMNELKDTMKYAVELLK